MIPGKMKEMFGLKDEKDLKMANNIWKMLDDMADSDPSQYESFIEKNLKEGFDDAKQKKDEKDKPYKVKPNAGFLLTMTASLNEKPLETPLNEKVLITKQPWTEVRKKFAEKVKIYFNITHCDRIKDAKSKTNGKIVTKYSFATLRDLDVFYYSLQGPKYDQQDKKTLYFCIILNSNFFLDLVNQQAGKKTLLGLCVSYLQQRLNGDKNPLLSLYNPDEHRRLAFYSIDKFSMEINEKPFLFETFKEPIEFLLEKQVDKKREAEEKKKGEQAVKKQVKKQPMEIKFRQEQSQKPAISELKISSQPQSAQKKILIEVLKQEQVSTEQDIAYHMTATQTGYSFEFLLKGISSIQEVDLEMKSDSARLKVKSKKQLLVSLPKPINEDSIKAKFKKKTGTLFVEAAYK